jgi:hypothetical protein
MRSVIAVSTWLLLLPTTALAQADRPPAITKIDVGFRPLDPDEPSIYKVGLWTPVHVEIDGGTGGIKPDSSAFLNFETVDSVDVGTSLRVPVVIGTQKVQTVTGYVKTGHLGNNSGIHVTLSGEGRTPTFDPYRSLNVNAHLYVILGSNMPDLFQAVAKMNADDDAKPAAARTQPAGRHVGFEDRVERLPGDWFGYDGADLVILATNNEPFLTGLAGKPAQLRALAQWVRRGGRLVIPVAWENQAAVSKLLRSPDAWQPPIPVVPPPSAGDAEKNGVKRLGQVEAWGARGYPFQRIDPNNPQQTLPMPIALLDPGQVPAGDWEVWSESDDGRPVIARVRYGLGQITYLAFSLEDENFVGWAGKEKFLQEMVKQLAPKAPADGPSTAAGQPNDLATDLLAVLDEFEVTVIPFGYVALVILIYVLVVGPLDFFFLKHVCKRMTWTWITVPAVVLAVSAGAYFIARECKGEEQRINKIDIVDFDMRTDLDSNRRPRSVHAYGQTFFTIFSPRNHKFTIGVEPNPRFWEGQSEPGVRLRKSEVLSWMGRPDGGPYDMNRSGSFAFSGKSYQFRDDATVLEGVPIPVWTTRAFTASWEQTLRRPPLEVDLTYHRSSRDGQGKELKITGTVANRLGVDLVDVMLLYDNRSYLVAPILKKGRASQAITIPAQMAPLVGEWAKGAGPGSEPGEEKSRVHPRVLIKQILFHESFDHQQAVHNHLLRRLDLGWRFEEKGRPLAYRTREAILFARVASAAGAPDNLTQDLLATRLWLGEIPPTGKARPALTGTLNQETFVRAIVAVKPAEE